jgi:translation elongation factor EF-Ts
MALARVQASEAVTAVAATVRENVALGRAAVIVATGASHLGTYVHAAVAPGAGAVAAAAALDAAPPPLEGSAAEAQVAELATHLAMQARTLLHCVA